MNGSSEESSLQTKQVVLDVIDILHAYLKYYLSVLYLTIKNVVMLSQKHSKYKYTKDLQSNISAAFSQCNDFKKQLKVKIFPKFYPKNAGISIF